MSVEIPKDVAEIICKIYLSELSPAKFCKFIANAEIDREDMACLVPLIRHFKALEQSLSELEIMEVGDLSPLEIK